MPKPDLLSQRMAALRLDEQELARIEPMALNALHAACRTCDSREQCALGLADDFADIGWSGYCPNGPVLASVGALPWFERRLPAG